MMKDSGGLAARRLPFVRDAWVRDRGNTLHRSMCAAVV